MGLNVICDHVIGMAEGYGPAWLVYESKRELDAKYIAYWFIYCPSCGSKLFKSFGPENQFVWDGADSVCKEVEIVNGARINSI